MVNILRMAKTENRIVFLNMAGNIKQDALTVRSYVPVLANKLVVVVSDAIVVISSSSITSSISFTVVVIVVFYVAVVYLCFSSISNITHFL